MSKLNKADTKLKEVLFITTTAMGKRVQHELSSDSLKQKAGEVLKAGCAKGKTPALYQMDSSHALLGTGRT